MFSKCQAVTVCNYQLLSVQIQVSEEISHHSEGLGICNYGCVRIYFHEVLDICGMIRLHMLYYQIIRFRTIQDFGAIAGTEPYENGAVYCATKHAVHAISQSMRADLLSHGIKVSEVRPGMVETEFSVVRFHGDRTAADNVYRGVEPLTGDDIAEAIAWIAQLPAHMNVNEIVLMPSQQACQYYVHRKS